MTAAAAAPVALILSSLALFAAATPADGPALYRARRFAEAERAFRATLKARPADEPARLYLARTLIEVNRLPEALSEIERLSGPASTPEARYQCGLILREIAERRFRDLEQAAGPGSPAVLVLGAEHLERQGDHAGALAQYRIAARTEPGRPGLHYAIGNLLWRARDLEGAEGELKRELEINPRHGMAQFRLGLVYIARGEEAQAAGPLEAAAAALPRNVEVRRELGKAYRKAGRLADARRVWEEVARARPDDNQVHFLLGGLYRELGEETLAKSALERHRTLLDKRRVLSEQRQQR